MSATSKIYLRFGILTGMIVLAAFSRIIPHPFGFSPLGAIGLFGAAYFAKKWQAILIPLAATFLSDLFLQTMVYTEYNLFYEGFYWQYIAYILVAAAGFFIFNTVSTGRVIAGALASTVIFFLVSNFGAWISLPFYTKDLNGLVASYTAAIPFLKGALAGDLVYSFVLFGTFAFAQKQIPALRAELA